MQLGPVFLGGKGGGREGGVVIWGEKQFAAETIQQCFRNQSSESLDPPN